MAQPNEPIYIIKDTDNDLHPVSGVFTVIGTQTASTGSWTGNIPVPALYDGLTIMYYLPWAGSGNATLNLTLADGTTTGAINCYYGNTTRLTTHYSKGSNIIMTYYSAGSIKIDGTVTTDNRWIANANYVDGNNTYYLSNYYNYFVAGPNKIFPYTIVMQNADGRWESIVTSSSTGTSKARNTHGFRLGQLAYLNANSTYAENAKVGDNQISYHKSDLIDHRYSFNTANNATSGTVTKKPVYLVGTLNSSDGLFYLDTTWWTQTLPTSDDGKLYIYLGDAYDYYRMSFVVKNPIYKFENGKLQEFTQYADTSGFAVGGMDPLCIPGTNVTAEGSNTWPSGNYAHAEGYGTSATGEYSHAEGYYTCAFGSYSHAEGAGTYAINTYSHAEGDHTTAYGYGSHTEGYKSSAFGRYSHAEGGDGTSVGGYAIGNASHAEGINTTAIGIASHTEGGSTFTANSYAHAEGYATSAFGQYSHAEGENTCAQGGYSHAEGGSTLAYSNYSHAEGSGTNARGSFSHAEGSYTTAMGDYTHTEGSATRTGAAYAHAEGSNTSAFGECSHAEGSYTYTSGTMGNHVEGNMSSAVGYVSHAEGLSTCASGSNASHSEGEDTRAMGAHGSHAEGYQTTAKSDYGNHAEGHHTYVSCQNGGHGEGYYATVTGSMGNHAEGDSTIASGSHGAHAEGYGTSSSGTGSHAEGYSTSASSSYGTHAEGSHTYAFGLDGAHAEGYHTTAAGDHSHAEGIGTIARGDNQHAEGKYNVEDLDNKYAHIIGGGSDNNNRKNILTVNWDGDICANSYGPIVHNAITHRNVYRGKNLGSTVTTDQYNAIDAGTFEDLYIGDYWVMDYDGTNTVKFYIVDFDPYVGKGSSGATATTKHHVMLFPSKPLPTQTRFTMEALSANNAGYKGCNFRLNVLPNIITKLNTWFGQNHILKHPEYLSTHAGTSGPGAGEVVNDCSAELFSVINIFGYQPVAEGSGRITSYMNAGYTLDLSILPLFRYANLHKLLDDRNRFVFRDIENTENWVRYNLGNCQFSRISGTDENAYPYFLLCKSNT